MGLPGAPMLYNEDSLGNADVSRDDCWELLALVSKKSNGRSTASTTVADNFDLSRQRTSQALTIIRRATLPRKKEHKRLLNKVSRDDDVMREVTGVVQYFGFFLVSPCANGPPHSIALLIIRHVGAGLMRNIFKRR
jgi:hypothetical protein